MIENHIKGRVIALRSVYNAKPEYRVAWNGRLCSPVWQQRGPAEAYLQMLHSGSRQPEYAYEAKEGI